jgi:hypothetical protein
VTRLLALAACLVFWSGCKQTRCEDLEPVPVAGIYQGGGSLGDERMLRVGLDSSSGKKVILTWTNMDGSQIRATYRIAKKSKKR